MVMEVFQTPLKHDSIGNGTSTFCEYDDGGA